MNLVLLRKFKSSVCVFFKLDFLYSKNNFSQWGESEFIKKVLYERKKGFYLDIGAHHPYRYSNTYLLYKNGWKGIIVEPDKKSVNLFKRARPKDITVNAALGKINTEINYYIFEDSALNTTNLKTYLEIVKSGQSKLLKTEKVKPITLTKLLRMYLPKNTDIDLINIDVEGSESEVIDGIDWNKSKPKYVLIEENNAEIGSFFIKLGYLKYKKYGLTQTYILK